MIVSCVLINVFHSRHFGCIFLPTWGCILLSGLSPISVGYGLDYPQNISSLVIYIYNYRYIHICLHYIIYIWVIDGKKGHLLTGMHERHGRVGRHLRGRAEADAAELAVLGSKKKGLLFNGEFNKTS